MKQEKAANVQVLIRIRPLSHTELTSRGSLGRTNVVTVLPGDRISVASSSLLEDVSIAAPGAKWRKNSEKMRDINVQAKDSQRKRLWLEQQQQSILDMSTASALGDQSFSHAPSSRQFDFDSVLSVQSSQVDVYERVSSIIDACLKGYNGTIVAYGQTGSGKTHTVFGDGSHGGEPGLLQRSLRAIFNGIAVSQASAQSEESSSNFIRTITRASFFEIFNERVHDLLSDGSLETALSVREDSEKGVHVEGLSEVDVKSTIEAEEVLLKGMGNRHVAATAMNRSSSRSHAVFVLTIRTEDKSNNGVLKVRTSKFTLVDLAGSERQKLTDTAGDRLKEASMINKSLTCLGHVINALSDLEKGRERHVHYRDSKLTFLLRDSWGGNSKTCLVATVSPSAASMAETLSTLKFAQRAKMIKNKAVVNENTNGTIAALQAEIERLRSEKSISSSANADDFRNEKLDIPDQTDTHRVINQQTQIIKHLKRKVNEEQMVGKFKQARIDILRRKRNVNGSEEEEVVALCNEIDSLRRQLNRPTTEAIEWKLAYQNSVDGEIRSPPALHSSQLNGTIIEDLEHTIAKLKSERTLLKTKIIKLEQASARSVSEVSEAADEIEKLDADIDNLRREMEKEKLLSQKTSADYFELCKKLELLSREFDMVNEIRTRLEKEITHEHKSNDELEVEVERLMNVADSLREEKIDTQQEMELLNEELIELRRNRKAFSADLQATEAELRQKLATMSKDNAIIIQKVKEATKDSARKQRELDKYEKKLAAVKITSEAEVALLRTEKETLRNDLKQLSEVHAREMLAIRADHSEEIESLSNQCNELKVEVQKLECLPKETDPRVVELEKKVAVVIKERDMIEFERDSLQEDQDTLTEQAQFLRVQNDELEEENAHFRKLIGIESSFASQTSDHSGNCVQHHSPQKTNEHMCTGPFSATESPILPSAMYRIEHTPPMSVKKVDHVVCKNEVDGYAPVSGPSTVPNTRTPFSSTKSRLNISSNIVQNAVNKLEGINKTFGEDSFDESMFLPNVDALGKENLVKSILNNHGSSIKKQRPQSQSSDDSKVTAPTIIYRSNWSFAM